MIAHPARALRLAQMLAGIAKGLAKLTNFSSPLDNAAHALHY